MTPFPTPAVGGFPRLMNPIFDPAETRILIVDDTVAIHEDFKKILRGSVGPAAALLAVHNKLFGAAPPAASEKKFAVDCVTQGQEALRHVQRAVAEGNPYSIAFVDMRMPPGWDGIETTKQLWKADPELQVVICTAYSDHTWEDTAAQLGTTDNLLILKKPFDNIEVLQISHSLSAKWVATRRSRERVADLDERVRQRTQELQAAEGRFTRVFQANPVPTTLQWLADGSYLDANPAFLRLAGYTRECLLQQTAGALGLWPEADVWQQILASLEAGAPFRAKEARLLSRENGVRDVLLSVEKLEISGQACVLTSIEDVTERLLLERKYQQAQKMEAVGQLAAGIAHDFNNLLTVIQSYTALVLEDQGLGAENREGLTQVRSAAARAAALTRQLLIFSRRQITRPEPVDLAVTILHMQEMLGRLMPEHIRLDWRCSPSLPLIVADEPNLEQVIINLAINARDAMPEGGTITLTAAPAHVSEAAAARHPDARPGHFLQLAVADTGSGMSEDVVAHIFEPFFTTKSLGKGTGLGLSTVYAIVRQHSGWIEVNSRRGEGTRFEIFLPTVDESQRRTLHSHLEAPEPDSVEGRGERILLVEDEPTVRLATRTIISRAGYRVTEAPDAPTALQIWTNTPTPFDLVVTDMVMPNGVSGAELVAQLRERCPGLRVIITTGYSQELLQQEARGFGGARLLLKPFTTTSLLRTMRELLDDGVKA